MRRIVRRGKLVHRHADQREREERRAAHRVHVGDRVGRGDAPKSYGSSTIGMKKSVRRDDRLLVVDAVDRGVVGRLDADQQLGGTSRGADLRGSRAARPARSCSRSRRRGSGS
jgi:hypothetical protein